MASPAATLNVVAAVLHRGDAVLIAQRPPGKDEAGRWEFPGGKVQPGESAVEALRRELQEELGVTVQTAEPLIRVPLDQGARVLWLDTWVVKAFDGEPRALEHSALCWVRTDDLPRWAMPRPDLPVVACLTRPWAYPITAGDGDTDALLGEVSSLLVAGYRLIQLRLPGWSEARRAQAIGEVLGCFGAAAAWLVNGDVALAQRFGIGVHLPARLLMALSARPLPSDLPVAASCHDAAELVHAERIGADFAVLGPVAATPSHPGVPGIGWLAFAALRGSVSLPVYALGGIGPTDLAEARQWGAQGVAGIRAYAASAMAR